jgi:hypothetical protein
VVPLAKLNRHVVPPAKHNSVRLLRGNRTRSFHLCSCPVMVIFLYNKGVKNNKFGG